MSAFRTAGFQPATVSAGWKPAVQGLLIAFALIFGAPAAHAQPRTDSAAAHHGVPVRRIVSPGGIEAWLVSDSPPCRSSCCALIGAAARRSSPSGSSAFPMSWPT